VVAVENSIHPAAGEKAGVTTIAANRPALLVHRLKAQGSPVAADAGNPARQARKHTKVISSSFE